MSDAPRAAAEAALQVLVVATDAVGALVAAALEADEGVLACTSDARHAVVLCERARPGIVVLDGCAPSLDAAAECRRLRAAGAPFVLLLAPCDTRADVARALQAGADDVLPAPATAPQLRARLALARHRLAYGRAQWLAGIGETTIALEHAINNPLTALLGHAELLALEPGNADERQARVDVVLQQARRIADVVRRLKSLRNPSTVEYYRGARMLDLSPRSGESGGA